MMGARVCMHRACCCVRDRARIHACVFRIQGITHGYNLNINLSLRVRVPPNHVSRHKQTSASNT